MLVVGRVEDLHIKRATVFSYLITAPWFAGALQKGTSVQEVGSCTVLLVYINWGRSIDLCTSLRLAHVTRRCVLAWERK